MGESKSRLEGLMRAEGLPYGDRTHTFNSRLAQELAVWADEEEQTDPLHDALFDFYFVRGLNIGDTEVLLDAAEVAALDRDEARAVIESRRFSDEVDRQWQRSIQLGVTGVPTMVAGGYGVVGAQPYEVLEGLMQQTGIARRPEQG